MKTIVLLLLMSSFCFADVKFGKGSAITDDGRIINNKEDLEKTYKLSCPDGYKLEGKITNRNNHNINCDGQPKDLFLCMNLYEDNGYMTDAELKCVKNN